MKPTARLRLFLLGTTLLATPGLHAARIYWDSNGTTSGLTDGLGSWLNAGQWWNGTTNVSWNSGDDAVFGTGGAGGAVTLASPTTVNSLTFNYFTGTYTLGSVSQTITLNSGITKNAGSGAVTIVSPITLGSAQIWTNNSAGALTINSTAGGTNLNGNALTIGGSGATSFDGNVSNVISGAGGIVKNGSGNLTLDGTTAIAHTFTGGITISGGGRVGAQTGSNLTGRGNVTINGGYLGARYSTTVTFAGGLGTGATAIRITGGVSGFSGEGKSGSTFTIGTAGSTLQWGNTDFNPSVLLLNGDQSMNSNGKGTLANAIDLNGSDRTVTSLQTTDGVADSGFTISGAIINTAGTAAGLTKTGVGNLILTAANTYDGATTISSGALNGGTNGGGAITLSGSGTINSTTTLNLNGTGTLRLVNTAQINRFADGAAITSHGGTVSYENTSGANVYTETMGSLAANGGQTNIVLLTNQASTGSQTLTFGGLSRGGTGSVTFSAAATAPQTTGNKNMIRVDGINTDTAANKIIGAWATVGTAAAAQTDYAVYKSDGTFGYIAPLNATSSTSDAGWAAGAYADDRNYAWGNGTTGMTTANAWNINSLRHTGGAETLTLNGNLGTYGILNGGSGLLTISRSSTEVLTLPTATAGQLYLNGGNGGITISAPIADNTGALTLVKNGSGALNLRVANTFTGDTIINSGTLFIGGSATADNVAGTLGNGNYAGNIYIAGGALLSVRSSANQNYSGVISGDGSLFVGGGATLTLSGDNTFTGPVQIAPTGNGVNGNLTVSSFNSVFTNPTLGTVHSASSSLGAPTTVANGTITLGQAVSGNVLLKYTGSGETTDRTLNFVNINNSSRFYTLDNSGSGLLKFTTTSTGATLQASIVLQGASDGELVGGLPFAFPNLTKSGNGTWTLGGAVGSTGVVTVNAGTLALQTRSALQGGLESNWTAAKINVKSAATLALNVDSEEAAGLNSTSLNTLLTNISVAGSATQGLQSGAILGLDTGTATGGSFTQGNAIANSTGANGGAIGLTKLGSGILVLDKDNTYTGGTLISAGTLQVGNGGTTGSLSASSAITNNATLVFKRSDIITQGTHFASSIGGTGGVTQAGSGKLVLGGTNTYAGPTKVSSGTLVINGSTSSTSLVTVDNGATLGGTGTVGGATTIYGTHSPGNSPGIQTFGSDLTYDGGASLVNWELIGNTSANAANPDAVFDQILVGGNLNFADATTLNLSFIAAGSNVLWSDTFWDTAQSWVLYSVTGSTSNFSNLTLDSINWLDSGSNAFDSVRSGSSFTLTQSGSDVTLNYVVPIPEPRAALLGGLGLLALLRRRRD